MLNKKAMAAASGSAVTTDPDFEYVSLLLQGDGTNGAQNNTFIDGSTNNFTVTRNGNATQGSFNPFGDQWSNYFDGTGDYLSLTNGTALQLSNLQAFTIEFWVNPQIISNNRFIFLNYNTVSPFQGYGFGIGCNFSNTQFQFWDGGVWRSFGLLTANVWSHIAITYEGSGTTGRVFVNGTQSGSSFTINSNISYTSGTANIGTQTASTGFFAGYISNLRIIKGTAVYTSAFTPPTAPLTAITNTSLLTCRSNRFVDDSSNNFAITRFGDVSVRPFNPFSPPSAYSVSTSGGSGYFDGTGDYLSVADNANLRLGTSAFTIQAWIYRNVSGVDHSIIAKGGATTGFVLQVTSTDVLRFTHGSTNIDTTTTISPRAWTHIAAVRTGTGANGFQLYINGVSSATATVATDFTETDALYVGADRSAATVMNGYIAGLKYTNGTAESISVPTAPPTATSNVALLLTFANAGIFDNASDNVLETVGNAQISTSVKKYGTGSLAFDGTGDWLLVPDSIDLRFGLGNFTVEFWLYLNVVSTGSTQAVIAKGSGSFGWAVTINTSNQVTFFQSTTPFSSTGALSATTWYHIAVVRSGTGANQTKIYIDGINDGTLTAATNFNQTDVMTIGANRAQQLPMNGYIDSLRLTKGVARYTADFTPPASPYPDQ